MISLILSRFSVGVGEFGGLFQLQEERAWQAEEPPGRIGPSQDGHTLPNGPPLRAVWPLLDGTWGSLEGRVLWTLLALRDCNRVLVKSLVFHKYCRAAFVSCSERCMKKGELH